MKLAMSGLCVFPSLLLLKPLMESFLKSVNIIRKKNSTKAINNVQQNTPIANKKRCISLKKKI
tara:strand:- start:634 stop:822 length:189 start_codon:yes stop_codon:yes gene_type:complete